MSEDHPTVRASDAERDVPRSSGSTWTIFGYVKARSERTRERRLDRLRRGGA